jgi:hypothetical protein
LAASVFVLTTLVAGLRFHVRAQRNDNTTFSNTTVNDKYGFHSLALMLGPKAKFGGSFPFAVSGYYEFHGDGTLNGVDTVSTADQNNKGE